MTTLKPAALEDFAFFYELKCEESNIFWTGHGEKPKRENLYNFFKGAVENAARDDARKIYIIENDGVPVGHLYLIPDPENNSFELAPAVSEKHRGKGYAGTALKLGLALAEKLGYTRLYTSIREDNLPSLKAFAACGARILPEYRMVYIPKLDKEVKMYFVEKELN